MKTRGYFKVYTILIFACSISIILMQNGCKTIDKSKNADISKELKYIPTNYYLSDRIPDCDSAVIYMNHIIEKKHSKNKWLLDDGYNAPREIHIKIKNEVNSTQLLDLPKFYINIDCFLGESYKIFQKTFCSAQEYQILEKLINKNFYSSTYLYVSIQNNIGFSVRFKEGLIHKVEWDKIKIVE